MCVGTFYLLSSCPFTSAIPSPLLSLNLAKSSPLDFTSSFLPYSYFSLLDRCWLFWPWSVEEAIQSCIYHDSNERVSSTRFFMPLHSPVATSLHSSSTYSTPTLEDEVSTVLAPPLLLQGIHPQSHHLQFYAGRWFLPFHSISSQRYLRAQRIPLFLIE